MYNNGTQIYYSYTQYDGWQKGYIKRNVIKTITTPFTLSGSSPPPSTINIERLIFTIIGIIANSVATTFTNFRKQLITWDQRRISFKISAKYRNSAFQFKSATSWKSSFTRKLYSIYPALLTSRTTWIAIDFWSKSREHWNIGCLSFFPKLTWLTPRAV